jgi:hypothetical protein
MAVLLVSFDPNENGQDYAGLTSMLRDYKHLFLLEGSWAIETQEATRAVYAKVAKFLSERVHVYVLMITKPFSSQCLEDVKKWLGSHSPQK